MRKINLEVGVYLPTNPDRIVVDIDYDSGRPLQSHAKVLLSYSGSIYGNIQSEGYQERKLSLF